MSQGPRNRNRNRNRPILGLAIAVAMAIPAPAAAKPVFVDRYTAKWTKTGNFNLRFYGTLADGTVCPPSPHALLLYSIDRDRSIDVGKREYVRSFSVSKDSHPKARALIEANTACLIAFSGEVFFSFHHVKIATITAKWASPIAERR